MADDLTERIAVLEVELRHAREDIADMRAEMKALARLFEQAKGARWAIITAVGIVGTVATALSWAAGFFGRH